MEEGGWKDDARRCKARHSVAGCLLEWQFFASQPCFLPSMSMKTRNGDKLSSCHLLFFLPSPLLVLLHLLLLLLGFFQAPPREVCHTHSSASSSFRKSYARLHHEHHKHHKHVNHKLLFPWKVSFLLSWAAWEVLLPCNPNFQNFQNAKEIFQFFFSILCVVCELMQ